MVKWAKSTFLIILILSILSPAIGFIYIRAAGYYSGKSGEAYITDLNFAKFSSSTWNASATWDTSIIFQAQDYALVQKKDDKYTVTIRYNSYSFYDMVQVLDPQQVSELQNDFSGPGKIPMGTFNEPEEYKNSTNETYWKDTKGLISASANEYFLQGDDIRIYQKEVDENLDIGTLEVTLTDLSDSIYLYYCATDASKAYAVGGRQINIAETDINKLEKLENYSSDSTYTMGFSWHNWGQCAASSGMRNSTAKQADVYKTLNALLQSDVSVTAVNGKLNAKFQIKGRTGITKMEVATSRNMETDDGTITKYLFNEFVSTEYKTVYDGTQTEMELDYEDLTDGYYFRITESSLASGTYYYGFLRLEKEPIDFGVDFDLTSGVARLTADAGALPSDATFSFVESDTSEHQTEYNVNAFKRFSVGGTQYKFYESSVTSDGVEIDSVTYPVTIEVKLPDDFDLDTTTPVMIGTNILYVQSLLQYIDTTNRVFKYTTSDPNALNATFGFIDTGTPMSVDNLGELEVGVYKSNVTIAHGGYPVRNSMANNAIINNTGYLEVTIDEAGKRNYQMYIELEAVQVDFLVGYMTGANYYPNGSTTTGKRAVDILSYQCDTDGNLQIDELSETYHLNYVERLTFPLEIPDTTNRYWFSFLVPLMDGGIPGDGSGEATALMGILSAEKVDNNPLKGYNKTVLKAKMNEAEWFAETMETEDAKLALEAAIAIARAVYDRNELTETEILEATQALDDALTAAGGNKAGNLLTNGYYKLPIKVYGSDGTAESDRSGMYDDTAEVTIEDGQMAINLGVKSDDSGEYITEMRYFDGALVDELKAVPTTDDDGKPTAFALEVTYTETMFEIGTKTNKYGDFFDSEYLYMDMESATRIEASDDDINTLKNKIAEADSLIESDYTADSWSALQSVIQKAEAILSVDSPSYDNINSSLKSVTNAIETLVSLVELREQIAIAKAIGSSGYTASSYNTLQEVIKAAETVETKASATKSEVDNAVEEIKEAISYLRLEGSADVSALYTLWKTAKVYTSGAYTITSFQTLEAAIASAKTVLDNENASQTTVDNEVTALKKAIEGLTLRASETAIAELLVNIEQMESGKDAYTTSSWDAFEEAMNAIKEKLSNERGDVSEEDLLTYQQTFNSACSELKERGDETSLQETISSAEKILNTESNLYTAVSIQNLTEAVTQVKEYLKTNKDNMSQDDMNQQKYLIEEAIASLAASGITELQAVLESLLETVSKMSSSDYSETSWADLESAVKAARSLGSDATVDDYETAISNLSQAIENLEDSRGIEEKLAELNSLVDEHKALIGSLQSGIEETSYAAWIASVEIADVDDVWILSEEQIDAQILWMNAEYAALVKLDDLSTAASDVSAVSAAKMTYEEFLDIYEQETSEIENDLTDEPTSQSESSGSSSSSGTSSASTAQTETKTAVDTETEAANETEAKTETKEETAKATEVEYATETKAESEAEAEVESPEKAKTDSASEDVSSNDTKDDDTKSDTTGTTDDSKTDAAEKNEESNDKLTISKSRNEFSLMRLMVSGTATSSNASDESQPATGTTAASRTSVATAEDGTYSVNYALWKDGTNAASMGNPAFVKPATIIIKNGQPVIYMKMQGLTYSGLYGHLMSIYRCINVTSNDDGWVYNLEPNVYVEYSDESDDYGKAGDYPSLVGMYLDYGVEYTLVEVDVPVMGSSRNQTARLRVYWGTLSYVSASTSLDGSIDDDDDSNKDTETLDYTELKSAIAEFQKLTSSDYISSSYYAVLKSVTAGNRLMEIEGANQTMVTNRAAAIRAGIQALVPVATEEERQELQDLLDQADKSYSIGDYTEESYEALTKAVLSATDVLSKTDVTAGMISQQIKAVKRAVLNLVSETSDTVKFTELQEYIETAQKYLASSDYTTSSKADLQEALSDAVKILTQTDVTQKEVDNMVTALKRAISKLEEAADKTTLYELLEIARSYSKSDYTEDSYNTLADAMAVATFVYKDKSAVASTVQTAASDLQAAISALVKTSSSVNASSDLTTAKETLLSWITLANGYSSSDYTTESYAVLATALSSARQVYVSSSASVSEVNAAATSLQSAISGLTSGSSSDSSDDDSSSSGSSEDDGYYSVSVRLWHATMNKASMGDDAVNSKAYVQIEDGNITMRLVTKKMTVSGITAHLHDFWIYDGSDYESAELVSTENSKWIYEFDLPNDSSTYYKCKVDPQVDVMGDEPVKARLKVTWSSLKEVKESVWDDLAGDTDDDDDDSSSSSSSSYTTELINSETGIRVQGNTGGPGTVLEVIRHDNGEFFDKANNSLTGKINKFVLYDIKLRSGTSYIQPTGSATLQIPIPTGYDTEKLLLYYVSDDGNVQEISGKVNGSYYEASVSHFSLYALAESDRVQTVGASAEAGIVNGAGSSKTAKTGSESSTGLLSVAGDSSSKMTVSGNDVSLRTHMIGGRTIPYTGDRTPVKELMGIGILAIIICLGTILSGKGRSEDEVV